MWLNILSVISTRVVFLKRKLEVLERFIQSWAGYREHETGCHLFLLWEMYHLLKLAAVWK